MKIPLISLGFGRALSYAKKHKFISTIVLIALVGLGVWAQGALSGKGAVSSYVVGAATNGTIISTISASGQVASLDEITVKPKASGDLTWIGVSAGDRVRAGQAIGSIDNTDAKQQIADAEQALAQAKLQYQKDEAQAPITFASSERSLAEAKTKLETTYNDVFTTISDTYLDLPEVVTGARNTLYGYDLSTNKSQWNVDALKAFFISDEKSYEAVAGFADRAESDFKTAEPKYDAGLAKYKTLTRYSSESKLEASLTESIDMAKAMAQALQSEINLLDEVTDVSDSRNMTVSSAVSTLRSATQGYLSTVNSTLSSLLAQKSTLDSAKQAVQDDTDALAILAIGNPDGSNPISLQSSQYDIAGKERSLQELKDALYDYTVVSPFAGTVASVEAKRGDSVSSGTSIATIITQTQVAEISLNEVDAAKISLGDKATLTFDAIDDLTLTGKVVEMDTVGAVSQGVVSYTVKIGFDTQDARVKSGMTVNASIQTAVAQDTLIVQSSAVKTASDGSSYVLVFADSSLAEGTSVPEAGAQVTQKTVTLGISDDTNVEIVSGLSLGEKIVSRSSSGKTTTGSSSGGSQGAGGAVRIGGPGLF